MNKKEKVYAKTNGRCIYCGTLLKYDDCEMEHAMPRSLLKNDYDSINNLFPSCKDCNAYKTNLTIEEFRKKLNIQKFNKIETRVLSKYHEVKSKNIIFYFEKIGLKVMT